MINKKNETLPWQEYGRWYHFFLESDGSTASITTCDPDLEDAYISGSYLVMPSGYHVVDYKVNLNVDTSSAATYEQGRRLYANGDQGVVIPGAATFDYADVWVFLVND